MSSILYIPHGGGPMPILGDPGHAEMVKFLTNVPGRLSIPDSIVVISAHWESATPALTHAARPELLFDYYGFPAQSYEYEYPAPGDPALAEQIYKFLTDGGFEPRLDQDRSFDHGMFIPLMLMYPDANIPCVQLSLLDSLDAERHVALGEAMATLRDQNVLILGSGLSYHNMAGFSDQSETARQANTSFDQWLHDVCCGQDLTPGQRRQALVDWQSAPGARLCHPREEHLLPLQVCLGVAGCQRAELVFRDRVMSKIACGLLW